MFCTLQPTILKHYLFDMNVHPAQHQTVVCTRQRYRSAQSCNRDTVERLNQRATHAVSNVISKKKLYYMK